jgi:glycosyltransferase involved in cell wall biosynthesis
MNKILKITIIVPLMNEEESLPVLYEQLESTLGVLEGYSYEILFVDDGSSDASYKLIEEFGKKDVRVRGLSLSRNFGHQVALMAGIKHAKGDILITMDGDLQHPPAIIPKLIAEFEKGFEIVNTIRITTEDASLLKNLTSYLFYKLINRLTDIHITPAAADFRLISRKVANAFLEIEEKERFTRGLISWMGFKQSSVEFNAPARFAGKSKYNLRKMIRFARTGITSFSPKPLKISFALGLLFSLLGLIYALIAIFQYYNGNTVSGWTSILVSVLVMGGIQLICIGVLGEYIATIFTESKKRPLFFIQDEVNPQ